jgi:hypothetical protein
VKWQPGPLTQLSNSGALVSVVLLLSLDWLRSRDTLHPLGAGVSGIVIAVWYEPGSSARSTCSAGYDCVLATAVSSSAPSSTTTP